MPGDSRRMPHRSGRAYRASTTPGGLGLGMRVVSGSAAEALTRALLDAERRRLPDTFDPSIDGLSELEALTNFQARDAGPSARYAARPYHPSRGRGTAAIVQIDPSQGNAPPAAALPAGSVGWDPPPQGFSMIGGIPARIRTEPELAHRVPVILGSRNLVLEAIKQGYKEADLNRRVDRIDQFLSKQDDQDALSADLEREMRRRSGRRL